jgi:hypothetical protein
MMQKLYLVLKEAVGGKFISAIVLLSVVLSVFAVGLYRIVGDSLSRYVNDRFASSIPPNTIRVSTRQPRSLFLFEVDKPKTTVITDRVLAKMRSMDGVIEIFPVSALRVPLQARVSYMGLPYRSDIIAFGVPYSLVGGDIADARYRRIWADPAKEMTVPVLVPRAILQSYNDGMAPSNNMPRMSERGALGFGFRLLVGKSSLKTIEGFEESDAVIAGFTDHVDSFALILPLSLVMKYNKKFIPEYHNEYQYAYVKVKEHASLIRVSSKIKAMDLVVDAGKSVSTQIMKLKETIGLIVGSLQSIIIIIAAIAISFATMIATLNRIEYYRTMRVIGASRAFLTATILVKYLILGIAGTWGGMKLLQFVSGRAAEYFHLTGIMVRLAAPDDAFRSMLLYGMLIPVLSTVPALVRLYSKGLSRD